MTLQDLIDYRAGEGRGLEGMGSHIDRDCSSRAISNGVAVVEEGPGNEATRVNDTIVRCAAVVLTVYVALRLASTSI